MTVPCTGVILAGGGATRYGGKPKGLERLKGERIIDRVASALSLASDELLLISNDPAAVHWLPGVRTEHDVRPGQGSLGGIHSALVRAGGPLLLVAWDMPFVPSALLKRLRAIGEEVDLAVPESDSRRGVEPLCAYYTPACIPAIERRLDSDDLRVVGFYDDVRVARLNAAEVAQFGDAERLFMNINTPADLTLAEQYASTTDAGDHWQEE
ncbi:MAG: molybdenum cofactor guanylyltransferase [Anaerolineae bacterium]|nr:molybdenum cofactor guanylyltransferase [Gemmatimonadaceae bacterium]